MIYARSSLYTFDLCLIYIDDFPRTPICRYASGNVYIGTHAVSFSFYHFFFQGVGVCQSKNTSFKLYRETFAC